MTLAKKIIIGTVSILVLLLATNWGINIWVNKKLPQIISEKNRTPYYITYKNLSISVWSGDIKASGITISPKSATKGTAAKTGIYAVISAVEVKSFSIWGLLFNDKIRARSITIDNPEVLLYQKTEKAINHSKSIRTGVVEPFRQIVEVTDIYLNKGSVKIIYAKTRKPILSAANIKIRLEGIMVNDEILERTIPFTYKAYAFSCDSVYYKNKPEYHISATALQTENDGLSLRNFELVPDVSRRMFVASLPKEKDLYSLRSASVDIRKLDWGFKNDRLYFYAGKITLDRVDADIYRSKMPADDLSKKPLYNKLLREMKFPMKVDTLLVQNGTLVYEEEIDFRKGPGKIEFHKFSLSALNIQSAFGNKKMADLKIRINCLFMNSSPMKVDWRLNVLDKADGFNIKGSILGLDTKRLASFSKPYVNITQKGIFDAVYFNITGNDIASSGDFELKYHGLKVTLYKKKEPKKKSRLKTAVANLLVKDDSGDGTRHAKVEVKRIPEKSFYNFFWRNIEAGLKDVLIKL